MTEHLSIRIKNEFAELCINRKKRGLNDLNNQLCHKHTRNSSS